MTQSNPSTIQQPEIDTATLERRALRTAVIILVAAIGVVLFYLFLAWQLKAWQLYALSGVIAAFVAATLVGIRLIRRGQSNTGTWIIIIGMYLVFPAAALLIADIALIFGFVLATLTFVVASQALPGDQIRRATAIGIGIGILTAIIDLLPLDYRLSVPAIRTFVPVITTAIVLVAGFFVARRTWRGNLRSKLIVSSLLVAIIPLLVVAGIVSYRTYNAQIPQALETQNQIALRVAKEVENFILARESELRALTDIRGLENLSPQEQDELLSSLLASQEIYDELILVDGNGQEQIYISRLEVVTEDDLTSRAGVEEFEQPKASGETYFSPVQFDPATGEPSMVITIPVIDLRTGEMTYALIANFRFKTVWDLMAQADVVGSGIVYMVDDTNRVDAVDETNRVVAHANPSVVLSSTEVDLPSDDAFTTGIDGTDVAMALESISLNGQDFIIVAELPQSEATALATQNLIITIAIVAVAIVAAAAFGAFMARLIATPISEMAEAAESISAGDFSQQVKVDTQDEIGILARAFNSMTTQLRDLIGSLEGQVASRTQALETSTEVSRRLSTILDQDTLVREVVEQLTSAFNYYHAHIYLFDERKRNLMMVGGTGDAGRSMLASGHKIEPGRGLVGRAAQTNQIVLIPDVAQAEGWLPNPLLPDTKAEVAVPIAIGEEVLGVLDVQQNITDGLGEQDAALIQSIANQVGIAVQNAQTYQRTQRQAVREARITAINQRIQSAATIDDVLQIAVSELGQALEAERSNVELSMITKTNGSPADSE